MHEHDRNGIDGAAEVFGPRCWIALFQGGAMGYDGASYIKRAEIFTGSFNKLGNTTHVLTVFGNQPTEVADQDVTTAVIT